jgi:hypothetical protein
MDSADHAAARAEFDRDLALARRRPAPTPTGRCRWCEAPCTGAYCDADCRDDHSRYVAARGYRAGMDR